MKLHLPTFALQLAIAALAPGAWAFWRFAAWRSRLQTRLDNLKSTDELQP
jgi:hypothetical protein